MGKTHKHQQKQVAMATRPRTRQTNPKIVDPISNTNNLNALLKSLGLYPADTVGDGNCLFRAISDQLFGSQSKHAELRREICNFIEDHKDDYAGFVEDPRGFDVHLKCMRQSGTYGGHIELSAFARLYRRNIKIIQPDVIFLMEHGAGEEPAEEQTTSPRRRSTSRWEGPMTEGTLYVAYHDWEHFSSVRNIKGPHNGLPKVVETPVEVLSPPKGAAGPSKHQLKQMRGKAPSSANAPPTSKYLKDEFLAVPVPNVDPTRIALPLSRATSPADSASEPSQLSSVPSSMAPVTPPDTMAYLRTSRSPKRSFEESEGEGERATPDGSVDGRRIRRKTDSPSPAPPTAPQSPPSMDLKGVLDFDSDSSLSPAPPDLEEIAREAAKKALTRRQRKRLGLPKERKSGVKIVIPGGRHPARLQVRQAAERQPLSRETSLGVDGELKEWEKNGSGRIDARGFKELRI